MKSRFEIYFDEYLRFLTKKGHIMKTILRYELVFNTDAAIFKGQINGLLADGWDLHEGLVVKNVTTKPDSPEIETTTLFQALTKVVPQVNEKNPEETNVQTEKQG